MRTRYLFNSSMVITYVSLNDSIRDASMDVYRALTSACDSQCIDLVALSGGLDSSIIASLSKKRWNPDGVAIITADFVSTDLTYCQMVSNEIGIPLSIYNVETAEILDGIKETIKILKNFNDIEIRNSVVMYMAIKWAVEKGYRSIATGDGADELFAGYDFLIHMPEEQLSDEIKRVCSIMHFPSHAIGKALGMSVVSPFLDDEVVAVARDIHPALKVRRQSHDGNHTMYGKWVLRNAFEDLIPSRIAWRPKSAMQDGSGTAGLTQLFDSIMDEESYKVRRHDIEREDGVIIRSRESLHYYEIFKENFGHPTDIAYPNGQEAADNDKNSDDSDMQRRCPYCKCAVGDSRFCRMCAAFPI